ncbi:acyltransferase [Candidatus Sulfurimonas marisnigri]|uniref:Acyltransferase n=1 Tax=Candidatus Sulfurimonas marisnigri TaxID=2740405 RepID=A0A7S7LYZ6_9BACT|nr:acyltransferase [Candidatus Sulfurimonas marisnigri]QOY54068.1 acyltransferase [Candidatus Sulfurimonas marisnigri]
MTLIQAFRKRLFYFLNFKKFKKFSKSAVFIKPDIIQGYKYISIGNNVVFQSMAWILAFKQDGIEPSLIIEDGTVIGRFSHIVSLRKVVIRSNVLIADKVYISDNIHEYKDINLPIMKQPILYKADVEIGENSWIGENVSVIGVKIGKHCIIGANSVVTKNIPDYSIAVGNPAVVIKKYNIHTQKWDSAYANI